MHLRFQFYEIYGLFKEKSGVGRLFGEEFYEGAVENLNAEMNISDQAELLPFDKRWEFAEENLRLGTNQ